MFDLAYFNQTRVQIPSTSSLHSSVVEYNNNNNKNSNSNSNSISISVSNSNSSNSIRTDVRIILKARIGINRLSPFLCTIYMHL